jgi:hypothetical protein
MSLFDGDLSVALTRITKSFGGNELDIAYATRNSTPFADHKYPYLVCSVEKFVTSKECVRSSKHFVETLKEIIDDCLVEVSPSSNSFDASVESATLLEDAECEIQIGLSDETLGSFCCHSSPVLDCWKRNWKVRIDFCLGHCP